MQYLTLDNTDLRVSRLAFGTGSLHHLFRQGERQRLLAAAFASGITHFDTSPYYGYGLAESDLGLFLKGRRGAVTLASKIGLYPPAGSSGALGMRLRKLAGKLHGGLSAPLVDWGVQTAERSLHASLRRLGTDRLDVLFLHEPRADLLDADAFLEWLGKQQSLGKIGYWGVAGMPERLGAWTRVNHPLAAVVQTRDSVDGREADGVMPAGRPLQFTYGYLACPAAGRGGAAQTLLGRALLRNPRGSVLFSSRRVQRIEQLTGMLP